MQVNRIDLPTLAAFVAACDWPSFSQAASALGLSASALTVRLNGLEADLRQTLFARHGRRSLPLPSAAWLYDKSKRILVAEEFLQSACRNGLTGQRRVLIEIDPAYSASFLVRVLIEVVREIHLSSQDCQFDVVMAREVSRNSRGVQSRETGAPTAKLNITTRLPKGRRLPHNVLTLDDFWVTVESQEIIAASAEIKGKRLIIPELPQLVSADMTAHLNRLDATFQVTTTATPLLDEQGLERCLADGPLLLPRSLLPRFAQRRRLKINLFDGLPSSVVVTSDGSDPAIGLLLEKLTNRLSEAPSDDIRPNAFLPRVTSSQLRSFTASARAGSMGEAARNLGQTPSAVSTKVSQLEKALGVVLLDKGRTGSQPTELSRVIYPLASGIERLLDDITEISAKSADRFQQLVRVGLPPSWGSDSLTAACVGRALARFHRDHPNCAIEVIEGSRDVLNTGVRTGHLDIAVVGRPGHHVGKLPIGFSENLSLIFNQNTPFTSKDARPTVETLQQIPLILAPEQLTMHQTFLTQMTRMGMNITPAMRLGSVPLIVSVIRNAPLGTILPASAVRNELETGVLKAVPLDHIVPKRPLWAIFSTDQPLSTAERHLLELIRAAFHHHGVPSLATGRLPHNRD